MLQVLSILGDPCHSFFRDAACSDARFQVFRTAFPMSRDNDFFNVALPPPLIIPGFSLTLHEFNFTALQRGTALPTIRSWVIDRSSNDDGSGRWRRPTTPARVTALLNATTRTTRLVCVCDAVRQGTLCVVHFDGCVVHFDGCVVGSPCCSCASHVCWGPPDGTTYVHGARDFLIVNVDLPNPVRLRHLLRLHRFKSSHRVKRPARPRLAFRPPHEHHTFFLLFGCSDDGRAILDFPHLVTPHLGEKFFELKLLRLRHATMRCRFGEILAAGFAPPVPTAGTRRPTPTTFRSTSRAAWAALHLAHGRAGGQTAELRCDDQL